MLGMVKWQVTWHCWINAHAYYGRMQSKSKKQIKAGNTLEREPRPSRTEPAWCANVDGTSSREKQVQLNPIHGLSVHQSELPLSHSLLVLSVEDSRSCSLRYLALISWAEPTWADSARFGLGSYSGIFPA